MKTIVGIDPGSNLGIASIDSKSKTHKIETINLRNCSFSEVLECISNFGEPIIVATDKKKPPIMARKVAAAFGARLYHPNQDLSQREKESITKGIEVKTDHERDALAAALYAKLHFLGIIEKIEREVDSDYHSLVKKLIITGKAANIETAIEMINRRRIEKKGKERKRTVTIREKILESELADARARNKALEKELEKERKNNEKKYYIKENINIRQIRESAMKIIEEKDREIKELEKIISGEYIIVCNYGSDMRNKAVIIENADDDKIRAAENAGASIIITEKEIISSLPVIKYEKANIKQVGKFLVVDRYEEKEDFEEWLMEYKEKRKKESDK